MIYKFAKNPPKPINKNRYCRKVLQDYERLLKNKSKEEPAFQEFFEKNPSLIPRSSGHHAPLHQALISQPQIFGIKKRIPDFMWLGSDSANFYPTLIEIEAPGKLGFKKDETLSGKFHQAINQILQWKTILSRPQNQERFYRDFDIPEDLMENKFKPRYILIFGRRSEFEDNVWLKQQRAEAESEGLTIMSFDRLTPQIERTNYVTCTVKKGKYYSKYLCPTFHLGPHEKHISNFKNLVNAIEGMTYTTKARKNFLRKKIPYSLEFLEKERIRAKKLGVVPVHKYSKSKE